MVSETYPGVVMCIASSEVQTIHPRLRGRKMSAAILPETRLLTRSEAAAFLGVKSQTLAVWATTKRYCLPMVKVGSRVRYRLSDIEAFLQSRTVGAVEAQ
ncbi:MAG: helix-turn-helix domain-containing protein [Thermoguttaceae bacterium]